MHSSSQKTYSCLLKPDARVKLVFSGLRKLSAFHASSQIADFPKYCSKCIFTALVKTCLLLLYLDFLILLELNIGIIITPFDMCFPYPNKLIFRINSNNIF